jgi:hypothetical protein
MRGEWSFFLGVRWDQGGGGSDVNDQLTHVKVSRFE